MFHDVPIIAVTGTSTPTVRDDILGQLAMKDDAYVLQSSFNRPNLWLEVQLRNELGGSKEILQYIRRKNLQDQTGIVYCMTCKEAEQMAQLLQANGISAGFYHGELSNADRATRQMQWMSGTLKCVCTTIAFGLGIDKADVRYVIHANMPQSLEAYYQQIGRAGRDSLRSDCAMFWNPRDAQRVTSIVNKASASAAISAGGLKRRPKAKFRTMNDESERVFTEEEREAEFEAKLRIGKHTADEVRTIVETEDGGELDLGLTVRSVAMSKTLQLKLC
jgi:RecQ family ATP-dependent DNA helicase